tara:strand:+ start:1148 stop:1621 length:474 start_codon:yes stop_codon:yes gene_type:complete
MKSLKQLIKEQEEKDSIQYDIPPEILDALEVKLKMHPLIRYVKELKALNSIPPAYTIFLHTGQDFDIFYEDFSLMVKIQGREYYLADMEEKGNAIEHINRLLTLDSRPIRSHIPPEADDDEESEEGPVTPTAKSPTPPPPSGDTDSEMEPNDDLDDM